MNFNCMLRLQSAYTFSLYVGGLMIMLGAMCTVTVMDKHKRVYMQ